MRPSPATCACPAGARDRAFARLLVATALRRLGQIDAVLDGSCARGRRRSGCTTCSGSAPRSCCSSTRRRTPRSPRAWRWRPAARLRQGADQRRAAAGRARGQGALAGQDAARLEHAGLALAELVAAYGEAAARAIAAGPMAEPPLDLSVKSDAEDWAAPARCRATVRQHDPAPRRAARSRSCRGTARAPGGSRTPPRLCRRACSATCAGAP